MFARDQAVLLRPTAATQRLKAAQHALCDHCLPYSRDPASVATVFCRHARAGVALAAAPRHPSLPHARTWERRMLHHPALRRWYPFRKRLARVAAPKVFFWTPQIPQAPLIPLLL